MAVLRKTLQKQDLISIETFINDNTFNSSYFNVISVEDTIPGGKSSFQILGSEFLSADVEIRVELLDKNGNPVFTEAIKYLGDKPSRHISIEVYEDTPAGVGTLTILGSVDFTKDGSDIPEEWKNLYNVKWQRNVYIDPVEKNTQPILFQGQAVGFKEFDRYQLPTLDISEQVRGVIVPSGSGGTTPTGFVTQSTFTGGNYEANASPFDKPSDVKDAPTEDSYGNPFPKPDAEIIPSITSYGQKPKNQAVDSPVESFTNSDTIYKELHGDGNELITPTEIFYPSDPLPPEEPNFTGQGTLIKKTSGDPFRTEFEGGIFKAVPSVNYNLVKNITGKTYTSSSFTASIIAVHSPDLLEIDRPFTIQNQKEFSNKNFKVPHKATSFEIDFEPAGQTQNSGSGESSILFRSFADITIKNMKTFSGDVHRIKALTSGFSEAGDFTVIADRLVEASDVLNDRNTPTLRQKIGVFQDQSHLDKHWKLTRVVKGKNVTSISTSGSLTFTSTTTPAFMNGVIISGSNGMADESIIFETKTEDLRVRPDTDYELKLRVILKVGEKDTIKDDGSILQQAKAKVRLFLSGSNIAQNTKGLEDIEGARNSYGDPVRFNNVKDENYGEVISLQSEDSNNSVGKLIDFGIVRIPFKPNFEKDVVVNNDTSLQVEVESGQVYLQRVELLPATETNFSPDEFTFVAPMPKLRTRPEIFDFKLEFYDRNGNKAEHTSIQEAVTFEGQNEVIQGTDNLLTGSLFIGNALLSGIEAGGLNSAFIRSVGYVGFTSASSQGSGGFMMFSGSVLPDSPDSYQGVGLEIHDGNSGSFKFRTHNEDGVGEFDVRTNKFFFGKVGEQFVSGSDGNLEISSSGFHLQADGRVTASQLHIDGGVITGSLVIGESVTVDAATANSIRVPTGGPPFKAEILADGYARFSTGSIASFNIDSNALFTTGSNSFYISGSAAGIPTQDGRQNQFISASKFQVSALGDVTASNVLIDGGTITNNVTVQGTFSANSILVPAGANTNNATAQIKDDGYARFSTGSIASFNIDTNAIFTTGSDSFYISGSAAGIPTADGAQNLFISSSKFQVSAKGDLTGSRVLLDGGVIGGFTLKESEISSSNGALSLKDSGQITGSLVQFIGGDIGGWTIASDTLTGGNVQLASAGTIKVGSVADATTTATTNAGFFADNSGNVLIKGNVNGNNYIKVTGGGGIDIKSTTFDLDATTLILDSGTNNGTIRLGASGGPSSVSANTAGIYMDGTGDFQVFGDADNFLRFDISDKLEIKAETFDLATSTLVIDSSTNSGKIALGATPNTSVAGTNKGVYLDGQGDFLVYGSATNFFKFDASATSLQIKSDTFDLATSTMILDSGTNSGKISLGSTPNTSVAGTNQGIYMDGTGDFLIRGDASNFLKMDGATFTIKSEIFALDTTNLDIDSASKRITINDGSADRIYIGEVDGGSVFGMKIFDGTGTADSDIIVEFGEGQNYIAGWTIGTDTISSNNLVLHSSGRIETSNFASGLRGWRIDSLQNGIAEFENARIRGTLSTTVFEKETINAVGGQLYVANSTMLTSSTAHPQGTVSASNATMSVVNVTGFTGSYEGGPGHTGTGKGEILAIKKVTDTGFSTEYVQVVSHSRLNPSSGTDLSGLLFVTRSYGGGIDETGTGLSSSLGDPAFLTAQQYEPGQVIVSTGRHIGGTGATTTGSGFVRINANPNDLSTPFIDIVERTGSAIYDVDLKVRLGDLSGLSSQYVRGADVKGFGLVTSNVFLTSSFFVGGVNEHISFQTGSFEAKLNKLNLDTPGLKLQGEGSGSSNKIMLGLASALGTGDGIFMDGGGDFRVGGASSNFVKFDASTGVLTVDGTINITGGATSEAIAGLQATATSSNAQSQSAADVDFASSGSQTQALAFASESNARADASGSIVSSSLGAKIDPYETQIVLSSGGMSLLKTEGQVLAQYNESINLRAPDVDSHSTASLDTEGFRIVEGGVTQSLFGQTTTIGVVTGSHLKASGSGLELLNGSTTRFGADSTGVSVGDPGNEHVRITTSGVELKDNTTTFGKFAATTTIGDTSTEHISISNTELRLKDGSTTRILMNSSGLTMGNHISINSSGNASFSGTVTIGGTDLTTSNTLNANTTADNVDLGNVENLTAQNQAQTGLIAGTTITGGGITLNGGGVIKTINKDSVSDTTAGFFMGYDGSGAYDFAIGDANSFLKWDGSGASLSIKGSITITNPGDIDVSDLNNDSGFTDNTLATTANNTANTANSTANTANTAAGNAQSAVDVIEEKVVITGAAVQVQNSTADKTILDSGLVSIVQGNVTSSLFTSTNTEIRGGTLASKTTASFDKVGVRFVDAGVTQSLFGANITQIGVVTGSHIQISGSGLELLNNTTTQFGVDSNGVNVGDPANEHVKISTSGVDVKDGTSTIASFGSNITLNAGRFAINDGSRDRLIIDADDIIMVDEAGAQAFNVDSGVVQVGDGSTDYVEIDSTGIDIFRNGNSEIRLTDGQIILAPNVTAPTTDAVVIAAGGVKIYDSATDYLHMGSDGLKVYEGDASNPVAQFGATAYIGKEATEHIKITNTSLEIKDGSTVFGSFGSTTKIGDASNEHVEINTSTIDVKDGSTTLSSFGATTTIGQTSGRHISIDGTDVRVKQGSTVKSIFGASSITLGHNSTTDEHVIIDGSGLSVKDGSDTLAVFAATTTVGDTGNKHVRIDGTDGVQIKNSSTVLGTFGPNVTVFDESTRTMTPILSGSTIVGTIAEPTASSTSVAGVETTNGKFKRIFGETLNASNVQATGSVLFNASRSFSSAVTSSTPVVFHDQVDATNALIEPSFQFSTRYSAKGEDAIGFQSSSGAGIFAIDTYLTSDGAHASPYKDNQFNVLGLRVMDNSGDLTGGAGTNFGGVPDTFSNYTFINATDKTRLRGPFVNAQGIRFQVQNDGSIVSMGDITAFSGVGSFQSVSDIKFKTDITELSGSLDKVLELNPSRFIWKNTDKRDIGFIAQEVELVIPEIVKTNKKGVIGIDETKNTKTIDYSRLTTFLVDAIQEQQKTISKLETRIEKLEK